MLCHTETLKGKTAGMFMFQHTSIQVTLIQTEMKVKVLRENRSDPTYEVRGLLQP